VVTTQLRAEKEREEEGSEREAKEYKEASPLRTLAPKQFRILPSNNNI
jgi:hypothetical protein